MEVMGKPTQTGFNYKKPRFMVHEIGNSKGRWSEDGIDSVTQLFLKDPFNFLTSAQLWQC